MKHVQQTYLLMKGINPAPVPEDAAMVTASYESMYVAGISKLQAAIDGVDSLNKRACC